MRDEEFSAVTSFLFAGKCHLCSRVTGSKSELASHYRREHPEQVPIGFDRKAAEKSREECRQWCSLYGGIEFERRVQESSKDFILLSYDDGGMNQNSNNTTATPMPNTTDANSNSNTTDANSSSNATNANSSSTTNDTNSTPEESERCHKFQCCHCKYKFDTNLRAMEMHAISHGENKFVEIGRTRNKRQTIFQPKQHKFLADQSKYGFGNNVFCAEILPPSDARHADERLHCRKCNSYSVAWTLGGCSVVELVQKKRCAMNKFLKHEAKCKKASKKNESNDSNLTPKSEKFALQTLTGAASNNSENDFQPKANKRPPASPVVKLRSIEKLASSRKIFDSPPGPTPLSPEYTPRPHSQISRDENRLRKRMEEMETKFNEKQSLEKNMLEQARHDNLQEIMKQVQAEVESEYEAKNQIQNQKIPMQNPKITDVGARAGKKSPRILTEMTQDGPRRFLIPDRLYPTVLRPPLSKMPALVRLSLGIRCLKIWETGYEDDADREGVG